MSFYPKRQRENVHTTIVSDLTDFVGAYEAEKKQPQQNITTKATNTQPTCQMHFTLTYQRVKTRALT